MEISYQEGDIITGFMIYASMPMAKQKELVVDLDGQYEFLGCPWSIGIPYGPCPGGKSESDCMNHWLRALAATYQRTSSGWVLLEQ
jgi:hypothetical protein